MQQSLIKQKIHTPVSPVDLTFDINIETNMCCCSNQITFASWSLFKLIRNVFCFFFSVSLCLVIFHQHFIKATFSRELLTFSTNYRFLPYQSFVKAFWKFGWIFVIPRKWEWQQVHESIPHLFMPFILINGITRKSVEGFVENEYAQQKRRCSFSIIVGKCSSCT